ncbi:MAG: hypothetical protein JXA24_08100 [Proteobacteria bacterium]|nr:hypothetical protein [Pseudomonadota bacterium]
MNKDEHRGDFIKNIGLAALRDMLEEDRKKLSQDARTLAGKIMGASRSLDAEKVHELWVTSKAETVKDESQWSEGVEALKIIEKEHPNFFPELMKIKDYERTWNGFKESLDLTRNSLKWTKWLVVATSIIALTSIITILVSSLMSCSHEGNKMGIRIERMK